MSFNIKKADVQETGTLYARNVTLDNIEYIRKQAESLGYSHVGFYINAVFEEIRRMNNAGGIKVRAKSGRRNKSVS